MIERASKVHRYGLAAALVVVGVVLSILVSPVWDDELLAAVFFFPGVTISAWFGGFGPGLVAVAGSATAIAYFWLPPRYSLALTHLSDIFGLAIFCAMGLVIAALQEKRLREAMATMVALRRSEQRYRLLFEQSVAGIYVVGHEGHVEDCNDVLASLLGYASRADVLARTAADFYLDPAARDTLVAGVRREGIVQNYHTEWRRRDGTAIAVLLNARDLGDRRYQVTVIDISPRVRAEAAERQVAELRAVTRLANGAAHEINNPLTAVSVSLELLAREPGSERVQRLISRGRDGCDVIKEIVVRMRQITRLELADQPDSLPEMLDIRKSSAPSDEPCSPE